MKSKKILFAGLVVLVAVAFGALVFFSGSKKSSASDQNTLDLSKYNLFSVIEPNEDNGNIGDHIKGDVNAPVTIFEYADYQCSGCANLNTIVKQLLKEYDGKLRIVYRNFPLTKIHPNAIAAASAVEAAAAQGYWEEYGDLLFANQAEWFYDSGTARTDRFMGYFTTLSGDAGDLPKFRQDMSSLNVKKKVEFDKAIAESLNIDATPSFFAGDGTEIPWMEEELNSKEDLLKFFRSYIDSELKKQESTKN